MEPLCTKEVHKIQNPGDIASINRACPYITGSIEITKYLDSVLELGSLSSIGGDLKVTNVSKLVRIDAPNLVSIGGTFYLRELTSLTLVSLPYLKAVHSIEWRILPILSTIALDAGIDQVSNILILDTSLVGFSLKEKVQKLDSLDLNNNRFLESITAHVKTISNHLSVSANSRNTMVSLPLLELVSNMTFRDVTFLDVKNVKEIKGSAKFYENYFQQLKVPKLTKVGGTLSIIQNNNLKEADFPSLTEVGGGLMITNNTNTEKINFFPRLKAIGGAIQFIGDFKDAAFSKLELVKGSATIKTSSASFDCSKWTSTDHMIIRGGNIVCASAGLREELNYDANDIEGTLTKSKTGADVHSSASKLGMCWAVAVATFMMCL